MTKITEIRFEITYNESIWRVIQELQKVAENFPEAVFKQIDDIIIAIPEEKERQDD